MTELEVYAENTRSLMFYMQLHLLGIDSTRAYSAASHLGRCYGIIDMFKKTKFYIVQNQNYMPRELLMKYNLEYTKIYDAQNEGHVDERFYEVILEVASYAKKHLELSR